MYKIYGLNNKDIEKMVYQNTPIETIHTINEYKNCIEVCGSTGQTDLIYTFYENGDIIKNK